MIKRFFAFSFLIVLGVSGIAFVSVVPSRGEEMKLTQTTLTSLPSPIPTIQPFPIAKRLENPYHVAQTFNNCGPASLSMALSYFGINKSQDELGLALRPYQNPIGDNDDKSVTLEEMAEKAKEYGLMSYHRPNGTIELLKQFIANDMPIIARTWLHVDEDIGHYRVVKGYNDENQTILQDDSYQGPNLLFTYDEFNTLWSHFDYEYLVLAPKDKQHIAEQILGKNVDEKFAWQETVQMNEKKLTKNPDDVYSRFNLSVALYYIGDYKRSVEEFEKVHYSLPPRTLWYQREPIESYFQLGNDQKVFELTDMILNNQNRAYSELYIVRGKIYQKQGNLEAARQEFQNAVYYNSNLKEAQDLLKSL